MNTALSYAGPMPRKFFRKYLPSHETVRNNRHIARFGGLLRHPNLWHLNRHSVAGGVAVGMFSGLVPGPLQMLMAALLAVPLRVNLPVALATTFYTNPFTIGPLYLLAYLLGRTIMGGEAAQTTPPPHFDWAQLSVSADAFFEWMLSLGMPLAVGLVALALLLALLGYTGVQLAWRVHVTHAWNRRARKRRQHER